MCLHPVTISNPVFARSSYAFKGEHLQKLPKELSSSSAFIQVPCCTCAECRNTYFNSVLQRGIVESLNSYIYFVMLSYDNNHIPSLTLPNGKTIFYSDYEHIKNLFKRLRANRIFDRDFRYLVVNEYGDNSHRPHFHILIYVSKKQNDDITYPYTFEKTLFNAIQRYFSVNIGTRKSPVYEPLFTYRIKYTSQGIKTNYFVKYVLPVDDPNTTATTDTLPIVKTIRYLLSYINKGSTFDKTVLHYLNEIKDPHIVKKLKILLSTKLRYSKGFGLSSIDGCNCSSTRYFVKTSLFSAEYTQYELPLTFSEWVEEYPHLLDKLYFFVLILNHTSCKNNKELLLSFKNDEERYLYIVIMRYFPNYYNWFYNHKFRIKYDNDNIGYLFNYLRPFIYSKPKVVTSFVNTDTPAYNYIRTGVENAIKDKVPFIAFPLYSSQSYMPLCKFYKQMFTDDEDTLQMYKSIGVSNFDEWQKQFLRYISTNKESKAISNQLLRETEVLEQKNCISKHNITDLYSYLLVKR